MKKLHYIIVLVVTTVLWGCGTTQNKADYGETEYAPRYATGFSILRHDSSSILRIINPWQGATNVEMELFISRNGEQPPAGFGGRVVTAPVGRVICMSSSYIAFIETIGAVESIVGVSGIGFITSDTLRSRYDRGLINDIGYDTNLNYELIASLKPDLVLLYGVHSEENALTTKLDEMGIQTIYIGDYTENSPLGKSEWIIAFGELFDKRERAEQIFVEVEQEYNALRDSVAQRIESRPTVMLNAPWRDSWFVPGDRSYMVQLINDAGGDYICKGIDNSSSRTISGETAYISASRADYWFNPSQFGTIAELTAENPKFADVKAIRDGRVYNSNKRVTPWGGSDFWESGAVYPNVILRDMVHIFHPELSQIDQLYYFKQLQ